MKSRGRPKSINTSRKFNDKRNSQKPTEKPLKLSRSPKRAINKRKYEKAWSNQVKKFKEAADRNQANSKNSKPILIRLTRNKTYYAE